MSEGGKQYSKEYQPKLPLQYESVRLSPPVPPAQICLFFRLSIAMQWFECSQLSL